ncbi:hypothetical protein ABIB49_003355 [Arthrobacter sp. UYCu512]
MRICCRTKGAAVPLAAGVHNEVRVACLRPFCVLLDQAAPTRIADILHHHGQLLSGAAVGRQMQPAFDPIPAIARERDIETVNDTQQVPHRGEFGVERELPGVGNGSVPEIVEVFRLDC